MKHSLTGRFEDARRKAKKGRGATSRHSAPEVAAEHLTQQGVPREHVVDQYDRDPMGDVFSLVGRLQGAADFQAGSVILLEALLAAVDDVKQREVGFDRLRALRGMLHHRSDGAYRHLAIVERVAPDDPERSLQPSSTAWRLIEERGLPVVINIPLAQAEFVGATESFDFPPAAGVQIDPSHSILTIGKRQTTHVLAIPVPGLRGSLAGMVSLEFRSGGIGLEFDWDKLVADLQMLLIVGAPHIVTLPTPRLDVSVPSALPVPSKWFSDNGPLLQVFASMKETMLIAGPTGAGKTFLARWIHENSTQRDGPFVEAPLNEMADDAGLPHLFGWAKGAFTTAVTSNDGWALLAEGGTLFLDEVDTLSKRQQEGLLRFLDTGKFNVMGTQKMRQLNNVRFIVATNADLGELVDKGLFRDDLYHRINTFVVDVPPLSRRQDEIPAWAQLFADQHTASHPHITHMSFTSAALSELACQSFPGNLRNLKSKVMLALAYASAEQGSEVEEILVDKAHVTAAESSTRHGPADDPVSLLYRSARSLVDQAQRSPESHRILDTVIRHKGLLLDMVWFVAAQTIGDTLLGNKEGRNQVAQLIGKETAVKGNNYGTELKKACERLSAFYGEHAQEPPMELKRILGVA